MTVPWDFAIVAFIDVLGFSALVETDASSEKPNNLERITSALAAANKATDLQAFVPIVFSDSIILSTELTAGAAVQLIGAVGVLQRNFVAQRILVRGGVAFGKHYSSSGVTYSEALVRAYRLESRSARFPRVLVEENLWDWFINDGHATIELRNEGKALTAIDRDGKRFVSYLGTDFLSKHREVIQGYADSRALLSSGTVLEKIQWAAEYHNYIAGRSARSELQVSAEFLSFVPG